MRVFWIVTVSLSGLLLLCVLAVITLSSFGAYRARRSYEEDKTALLNRARSQPILSAPDAAYLGALPTPVRSYADRLMAGGRSGVREAVVEQTGTIRTGPDQPWMPFTAEQVYSLNPPGFLWLAQAPAMPGVSIWVRDQYVGGAGKMRVRMFGLFTLADATGPELDQGAALRYWTEILIFPYAAFGPGVTWRPIDARHARVTFADAGRAVDAVLDFDDQGNPFEFHAQRYQTRGNSSVLLPWTGRLRDWKIVDGIRMPARWEAVWHQPEGDFEYFRMDILHVRVE